MKKPSEDWQELQQRILGFGGSSGRKSYYPALRRRTQELEVTQSALQTSELRLQLAVEGAQLGMWEWDLLEGQFFVNDQWRAMVGLGLDELPDTLEAISALVHPEDRHRLESLPEACEGSQPITHELRLRHKSGDWVVVLVRGGVITRAEDGAPLRAAGTQLDISELRRAEQEQRRLAAQVQQAQKLESLGVLAGGIAHDFNNLLVAILGYAELCLMDLPPGTEAAAHATEIRTAATRAAELTNQMLAYSGKGRFVVEPLDLSAVVQEMVRLLSVSIPKRVQLDCALHSPLPRVAADVAQVRQVVMNLVTNAADAIPDRAGTVKVVTRVVDADAEMLSSAYVAADPPPGRYVCLEVTDDGCGMDEATLQRLFDPFFTTKATGRGLGMAAVLGIVRGHHGAINVDSRPGQGTTFRVLLPASAPAEAALSATPGVGTVHPTAAGPAKRILVVDDEPSVRTLTRRALERSGWRVDLATDGPEALAIYEALGTEIDLVLLDMTMPKMDGREVFRRLVALDPQVRVVLTSGFSAEDAVARFGSGLCGFIQKPYALKALQEVVREALEDPGPA